ncbi:MAG: VOC family protein [Shimia sp.]
MIQLEHVNVTVSDGPATAAWLSDVFGWHIRWQGEVMEGAGHSIHIGTDTSYVALYTPKRVHDPERTSYTQLAGLNHIAVVVDDMEAVEARVSAAGFTPGPHQDYEPGRRFYFDDHDGIEWEVVQYPA